MEELEKQLTALNELQTRYDALLQMYGEKMEECQELRLDLEDVKEMYKIQVSELGKKCKWGFHWAFTQAESSYSRLSITRTPRECQIQF